MFLTYYFAGLLVFVTLFVAIDAMTTFVKYEVGVNILLQYYAYMLPGIIYQLTPVACLVGTVFTLGTLNKNHEMVALFSLGMSLARMSMPILVLVSLVSAFTFFAGDQILPSMTQRKNYIYYVEMEKKPHLYSTVKTDKIWYRSENVLFNIATLNPDKGIAQGLSMYYFSPSWDLIQMLQARSVNFSDDVWQLTDGSVTLFTEQSSFPLTKDFKKKTISMGQDVQDLMNTSPTTDVLSVKQLANFIKKNKAAGLDTIRYEVDYHSKYGFAFAAFVMSLLGIPFTVGRARSGGLMVNMGLCMGLAFLYWSLYSSSLTLGRYGYIDPRAAAWSANLVVVLLSVVMLLRLRR